MDRREWLASVGLLALPSFLSRALAQEPVGDERLIELSRTYRAAQRRGRPLLVWLIPASTDLASERAHAFGELLNHGGQDVLADLALAEVVCARLETLRRLVPQVVEGAPLMVLVETDSVPAVTRHLDGELPDLFSNVPSDVFSADVAGERQRVDARIAILARLVHEALAPDEATLARRAAQASARLSPDQRAAIDAAIRAGDASMAQVELAAGVIAYGSLHSPHRERLRTALAEFSTARLVRGTVRGSRWALEYGCGLEIEPAEGETGGGFGMLCGMGHVAERSERFLYWMTR